jgi:hypothetical protein
VLNYKQKILKFIIFKIYFYFFFELQKNLLGTPRHKEYTRAKKEIQEANPTEGKQNPLTQNKTKG